MSQPKRSLIENVRRVVDVPSDGPIPDAELLGRWVNHRDEAAFELLLRRHGPMVLSASRRQTGDANAAEDAFQATWLIFLRHAAGIRRRDSLPAWLHRAACRVALRIRASAAKRMERERPGLSAPAHEIARPNSMDELEMRSLLDEEINRLPRHYRWAFVVCVLEGKPYAEAAQELGRPQGTIASWAARAREKLRDRLVRRGVACSAGTASLLTGEELAASLPSSLIISMVNAARVNVINGEAFPSGTNGTVSPKAMALAREVGRIMLMSKIRVVSLVTMLVLLATTGVVALPVSPGEEKPDNKVATPMLKADPPSNLSAKTPTEEPKPPVVLAPVLKQERSITLDGPVDSTAFSPDGKILACGHLSGVKLINTATGEEIPAAMQGKKRVLSLSGQVRSLAFSPDGKLLATAGFGKEATVWDVETQEEQSALEGEFSTAVAFSSDGNTVASAHARVGKDQQILGEVKIWDTRTVKLQRTLQWETQIWCLAFSKDGNTIAAAGNSSGQNEILRLWNPKTGAEKKSLKHPDNWSAALPKDDPIPSYGTGNGLSDIYCLAFAPDGKTLAAGGNRGGLVVFDAESLKVTRALMGPRDGHKGKPQSVQFAADSSILLSSGADGTAKLWDPRSGRLLLTIEGKKGSSSAALSSDGKMLAAGGDTIVKLWNIEMGRR